jgi:hypothetical protein
MKYTLAIAVSVLLFWSCQNTSKQEVKEETNEHAHHGTPSSEDVPKKKAKSPKTNTMANIGENHVHIEYSSPSVRGRQVWGGLVPYGEVWASGAHNATSINFSNDVIIGEVEISKGKYAFFTIPGEKEWTVIINKNWDQHLADDYNHEEDIVRVTVVPEENEFVEALKYSVVDSEGSNGYINLEWAELKVSLEVVNN